jgi:uncharacterized membrane protein
MRFILAIVVFLVLMAWQYRKNKPLLFVIVASLFAAAGMASTRWENQSELPLKFFAIAWLACMLIAGVLALDRLGRFVRNRRKQS